MFCMWNRSLSPGSEYVMIVLSVRYWLLLFGLNTRGTSRHVAWRQTVHNIQHPKIKRSQCSFGCVVKVYLFCDTMLLLAFNLVYVELPDKCPSYQQCYYNTIGIRSIAYNVGLALSVDLRGAGQYHSRNINRNIPVFFLYSTVSLYIYRQAGYIAIYHKTTTLFTKFTTKKVKNSKFLLGRHELTVI